MILTFSVGSKCAVMLPRKFINPQVTPAKGLIINRLLDSRSLILIEEIWQFKGLKSAPLTEMCISSGKPRQSKWGWQEIPEIVNEDEYIILPVLAQNLMEPSSFILDKMIKKSILDFKNVHGFM